MAPSAETEADDVMADSDPQQDLPPVVDPDRSPAGGSSSLLRTTRNTPADGRPTGVGFVRSVALLASGTAAGQAIIVLASPILLRFYQPDQVGVFSLFLSLITLGTVIVTLRYDAALPLPSDSHEATDLLILSILVTVVMTALLAIAGYLLAPSIGAAAGSSTTVVTLWPLIAAGSLLSGLQQILSLWATRVQAFGPQAASNVAAAATQSASQTLLGWLGVTGVGLPVGYMAGRVAWIATLVVSASSARTASWQIPSAKRLVAVADRYRRFPLFTMPSSVLNALSAQAPVLLLTALFDLTVVGWFSLTLRILYLPGTLIGAAVGQVYYARIGRVDRIQSVPVTTGVFRGLLTIGTGPLVVLAIAGQDLFAILFGEQWREAGRYAQWMAPWLLLVFIAIPLAPMVLVRGRQRTELVFQFALLVVRVTTLLAGWALHSPAAAVALFAFGSSALYGGYLVWLLRLSGLGTRLPIRWFTREIVISLLLAAPLIAVGLAGVQGPAWVAAVAATILLMTIRVFRAVRRFAGLLDET